MRLKRLKSTITTTSLANVCYMSSPVRLSVTFVHPTQAIAVFRDVSTPFGTLASVNFQVKFYGDRPRITPPSGELNTRGVAEYSDSGTIERYILETVKMRAKLVLIINRKSYMSLRLVPKSVTLNDLERRNGRYIALFRGIW